MDGVNCPPTTITTKCLNAIFRFKNEQIYFKQQIEEANCQLTDSRVLNQHVHHVLRHSRFSIVVHSKCQVMLVRVNIQEHVGVQFKCGHLTERSDL